MSKHTFLLCNCANSMPVDGEKIGQNLGVGDLPVHTNLCRTGIADFEAELNANSLCVGCTQETTFFAEIAEEAGAATPSFFNIREFAGWSSNAKKTTPKMVALTAHATLAEKPTRVKTLTSDGLCLVLGSGQECFEAAELLNQKLSVTLVLTGDADLVLPAKLDFPIFKGNIKKASGSFGSFEVTLDDYAALLPSSKSELVFAGQRNDVQSQCSVIVDFREGSPLFTRHDGRDGYLRTDLRDPAAVMRTIFEASELVGEFEKPIYVDYNSEICAHSRSKKVGCTKCLDNCPAGAITANGDHVAIDLDICGGCGNCAAHCPTGAVSYLFPDRTDHIKAIQTLASSYYKAGGEKASLLIHDKKQGLEIISLSARYGKGLPASLIPLEVHSPSGIGHDALVAAFAAGFTHVVILGDTQQSEEYEALKKEISLTQSLLSGLGFEEERLHLIFSTEPDEFEQAIWDLVNFNPVSKKTFAPLGSKREIARMGIGALAEASTQKAEIIPLSNEAPYGLISVDRDSCTLCLSCVSACPADALRDNPDKPELRFVETACVQCGLCQNTCPESAISLTPQLNLLPSAMQPVTLNEEEPFECIKCGTPFAAKSTIEKISEKLAGSHRMFESDANAQLIKMCDTCRLETMAETNDGDPFALAKRPVPRTTDDYISAEKSGLTIDDFLTQDETD